MDVEKFETVEGNPRVQRGLQFLEQLWWQLAKKIILMAGKMYEWSEEEWKDMQELFLRPNDYKIILKLDE